VGADLDLGGPGHVVPVDGATRESRPAVSRGSLDADAVARPDEVSAVPRGFPPDFARAPDTVSGVRPGHPQVRAVSP